MDTKNFNLVGSNKMDNSDSYFFQSITPFFLNEKGVYFVGKDKISRVDTSKIKVIITYKEMSLLMDKIFII